MNEVFVSYKREDEARVSRLVQALTETGLSVWWDRGLPGGESWRQQIQTALDAAKCVIVVWTHDSVGPAGDFVRDEAGQAKRRGVLVPVFFDKISPPLGFGELQAIDLTHWKGNSRDPFFQDVLEAVRAKLDGRPVPPSKGPMKRLVRRLTWSSLAGTVGVGGLALAFNLFSAQEQVCALPLLQPKLSDICGGLGLGHRPARAERLAWDRCDGSCDALRKHIEQFPDGAYREQAADLLTARRIIQTETWTPSTRPLALFVGQESISARDEATARSAALARAQPAAERLCKGFAATTAFHLKGVTPVAQQGIVNEFSAGSPAASRGRQCVRLKSAEWTNGRAAGRSSCSVKPFRLS